MIDPEDSPTLPDYGIGVTVTHIEAPSKMLKTKLLPPLNKCGIVITMLGAVRIHFCGAQFEGKLADAPRTWGYFTTGPGHYGYGYMLCPTHTRRALRKANARFERTAKKRIARRRRSRRTS